MMECRESESQNYTMTLGWEVIIDWSDSVSDIDCAKEFKTMIGWQNFTKTFYNKCVNYII